MTMSSRAERLGKSLDKKTGKLSDMRKEYTKMRDVVNKRVGRARAAGYLTGEKYDIPKIREIKDNYEFAQEYTRLKELYENENMTLTEFRKETKQRVESLHEVGYSFVNEQNELQFGQFMGYMVNKYSTETEEGKKLLLDSDVIASGFDYVHSKTKSSNHSTISRLFNEYLRSQGMSV